MSLFWRVAPPFLGMVLMLGVAGAFAQVQAPAPAPDSGPTDLNEGKTPAQLFAGDCAVCHAKPQGLIKTQGGRGLAGFLRQHYTSSIQTADALAAYLNSAGPGTPAPVTGPQRRGRDQATAPAADEPRPPRRPSGAAPGGAAAPGGSSGPATTARRPERPGAETPKPGTSAHEHKPASEAKASEPAETKPAAPKAESTPVEARPKAGQDIPD